MPKKKKTQKTTRRVTRRASRSEPLKPEDIEHFKFLLLQKRAEILGDVTCMKEETLKRERSDLSNVPFHMADAGSDNFELENTLGLMDEEVRLLAEIDAALERIENGTYGICIGSGKQIPKTRLEAIPWARYCVEYAEQIEKGTVRPEQSNNSVLKVDFRTQNDEEDEEDEEEDEELEELGEAMVVIEEDEEDKEGKKEKEQEDEAEKHQ